jgi:hypothetical protein
MCLRGPPLRFAAQRGRLTMTQLGPIGSPPPLRARVRSSTPSSLQRPLMPQTARASWRRRSPRQSRPRARLPALARSGWRLGRGYRRADTNGAPTRHHQRRPGAAAADHASWHVAFIYRRPTACDQDCTSKSPPSATPESRRANLDLHRKPRQHPDPHHSVECRAEVTLK